MAKRGVHVPPVINGEYEQVPVETLKTHPRNVNQGDIGAIHESITANGFYGACVAQKSTRRILAGNHRFMAAVEAKLPSIPVVWVDIDDDAALRILLADNRTTRLGNDDPNALMDLLAELAKSERGLLGTAYSADDLDALIETLGGNAPESGLIPGADPDEIPEAVETRCKLGDMWRLGDHRLLCGDCTDAASVERLMGGEVPQMVFADPPYGVNIVAVSGFVGGGELYDIPFGGVKNKKGVVVGGSSHMANTGKSYMETNAQRGSDGAANVVDVGKYAPIVGDETTDTAINSSAFALASFPDACQIWWGGNYYANRLPASACWLVWDKENTGNFADCELAWTNQSTAARIFKHMWNGMVSSEHGQRRVHPTQKPVALAEWCFDKYGKSVDIIFDPFCGSGMSIMAAENTGRKVYAMELSPEYCSIILTRWEKATGKTAELIEGE